MAIVKKFTSSENFSSLPANLGLFFLRVVAGGLMVYLHGSGKFPPSEGFINAVGGMGFPAPFFFAWMASLAEFVGAICLVLGLFTRPAAFGLMITMGVAAFLVHGADPLAKKELALIYGTIALTLFCTGAGRLSLDRFLNKM